MKALTKNISLTEGKYDFIYLTNDKAIEAKNQILSQLMAKGFNLPIQLEITAYKKSKIVDFNIFDGKLEVIVEYYYTDYYTKQTTVHQKTWDLKRAIGEVRAIKSNNALKFLNALADITIEINKLARPDIKVRRNNTVFEMLTPEIAEELKNHIKKIVYRIPLLDTYDFDVDKDGQPLSDKALKKLEDIFENFFKLDFAEDALALGMVENRPATEDTNHNIESSWAAVGNITFDCPINKLSTEAQAVIYTAKVKKVDDSSVASDTTNTTSCYRLANMLIRYFNNDVSLFSGKSTTKGTLRDWSARTKSLVDNDLFVDFDEPLEESAPRVVSKETSKLCSVVFDDHQIFVGTYKECEDWLKKANGPMADRLSIKNTAKVIVQESTPKVVRKQSDDIWTLVFKDNPEYPIYKGDKAKINAFYNEIKDQPAAKAHGGLVIKQGGEYTLDESLTESRSVADIEAEIARLQQELEQAKVAEKKTSYGGNFPKTVWTWDIYLEPAEKGTWTGIESDLVFETKDKALDAAWTLLNELDDEGELEYDPDDYYVEAFEIPLSSVSKEVLSYSNLKHLI
jgi:hypothetical protein